MMKAIRDLISNEEPAMAEKPDIQWWNHPRGSVKGVLVTIAFICALYALIVLSSWIIARR